MSEAAPNLNTLSQMDDRYAALDKLEELSNELHTQKERKRSNRLMRLALKAWRQGRIEAAGRAAMRATEHDETNPKAYHLLGLYLERMGFVHKALVTYERAFQLDPENPDLMLNLGTLAYNMKEYEGAARMFSLYIAAHPSSPHGYNNLANTQSEQGKSDEAIETLRQALFLMPQEAILWNSLGIILVDSGRIDESFVFFSEAVRLEPQCGRYYHNLAHAFLHCGRLADGLECYEKALALGTDPADILEMKHSRAICLIGLGRLEEGFAAHEIRLNERFRTYAHHVVNAPYWKGEDAAGKKILIVGEQGLGDEILFANILPDLSREIGPGGKLMIAVDKRMIPLFQRSYPNALVDTYADRKWVDADGNKALRLIGFAEGANQPDYWALMGSPIGRYRKRVEDFPREAFLTPDPVRVAALRERLAAGGPGLKVGICWRSMLMTSNRAKFYSPLDLWGPVLTMPGVRIVNLQYGDCQEELARAEQMHGARIEIIEGLDLKDDIDGAAALAAAVDLVISAPTASAALAAAVGTETWFLTAEKAWVQLSTNEYPWYRKTRAFTPAKFGDWPDLLAKVAAALKERASA
jgi:Tfp pilus assembly protein PilF